VPGVARAAGAGGVKRHALGYLWSTLLPWLVIGSTLTLAGCSAGCAAHSLSGLRKGEPAPTATPEPEKPSILLKVYPRVGHAPAEVRVSALVKDPGNVLYCPSFEIEFGDGCVSKSTRECPPNEPVMDGYSWPLPNHKYREAGAFIVTLRVKVGDDVVLSESARLFLAGPDEDDDTMRTAASR
jgi:hypothetical protein